MTLRVALILGLVLFGGCQSKSIVLEAEVNDSSIEEPGPVDPIPEPPFTLLTYREKFSKYARYQHTTTISNGKIIVIGGSKDGSISSDQTEIFHPETQTWSVGANLIESRYDHSASVLPNGEILVSGGYYNNPSAGSGTALASSEIYNSLTNSWSSAGSLNIKRTAHQVSLLTSGKVLVSGGWDDSSGAFSTIIQSELYDPQTNQWLVGATLNFGRYGHQSTLLPSGKVIISGGLNDTYQPLSSAEIYDPTLNTWTLTLPLNAARSNHTQTLLPSGLVLVTGGNQSGTYLVSAELFDPATNSWTQTSPMNYPRHGHTATLLPSGKVLITGGITSNYLNSDTAEIFDPISQSWSLVTNLNVGRYLHTATLLSDGKVFINHGSSLGGSTAISEIFDPVTLSFKTTNLVAPAILNHQAITLLSGKIIIFGGQNPLGPSLNTSFFDPVLNSWSTGPSMNQAAGIKPTATLLSSGEVFASWGDETEIYDPVTNSWLLKSPRTSPAGLSEVSLLNNGKVLVSGGLDPQTSQATSVTEIYNPLSDSWTTSAPMGLSRFGHSSTLLVSGKVLVVGGMSSLPAPLTQDAELYDPLSNSWSFCAAPFTNNVWHTATLLPNGKVFLFSDQIFGQIYDPVSDSWSMSAPSASGGRIYHQATLMTNGKVMITGGTSALTGLAEMTTEIYDPLTNSWEYGTPLVDGRESGFTATALPSGQVFIYGGWGPFGTLPFWEFLQ